MLKLNNCPFCNGSAYICKSTVFFRESYSVQCSSCEAHTIPITTGYNCISKKTVSSSEAAFKVVKRWNGNKAA